MRTYLKRFDSHDDYVEYAESSGFVAPNLSCCSASTTHIHYNMTTPPLVQGHEYVDLGLPSGKLWATEDICDSDGNTLYFAWGEVLGYTQDEIWDSERAFNWSSYGYANGDFDALTKYCPSSYSNLLDEGFSGDNLSELVETDDAAYVVWGNRWHTPSLDDFNELYFNTISSVTYTEYDCYLKFTSTVNGNSVIFKCNGLADGSYINEYDNGMHYWTRDLCSYNDDNPPTESYEVFFSSYYEEFNYSNRTRYNGLPIRPIASPPSAPLN